MYEFLLVHNTTSCLEEDTVKFSFEEHLKNSKFFMFLLVIKEGMSGILWEVIYLQFNAQILAFLNFYKFQILLKEFPSKTY